MRVHLLRSTTWVGLYSRGGYNLPRLSCACGFAPRERHQPERGRRAVRRYELTAASLLAHAGGAGEVCTREHLGLPRRSDIRTVDKSLILLGQSKSILNVV